MSAREIKAVVINIATQSFPYCIIGSLFLNSILKSTVKMLYLNAYDISRKRLWAVQLSWWHQMHVHFISGDITKKYL